VQRLHLVEELELDPPALEHQIQRRKHRITHTGLHLEIHGLAVHAEAEQQMRRNTGRDALRIDRSCWSVARLSELLSYRCPIERGRPGMGRAGGAVAEAFPGLGEQIGKGSERLGAPWRQARGRAALDVAEDLADEVWIGDVCDDP
jgi:hypothetical protein